MADKSRPPVKSFLERSQEMGTKKGKLVRPTTRPASAKTTILEMRLNLVRRAEQTIYALSSAYTPKGFRAPMARSVRHGVRVKIGYGGRNQTLNFGETSLAPREFLHQDKYQAVEMLNAAIEAINNGEFDSALQQLKASYAVRFQPKNKKAKPPKEQETSDKHNNPQSQKPST